MNLNEKKRRYQSQVSSATVQEFILIKNALAALLCNFRVVKYFSHRQNNVIGTQKLYEYLVKGIIFFV